MSDTIFYGTGRRKRSVARVYMTPGKGEIKVNGQSYRDYLCRDTLAKIVMQPLVAIEGEKAYNIGILEFFYKDKKGSRIIIESHR